MVRAKFKCTKIERVESSKTIIEDDGSRTYVPSEMQTIHFSPVFGNGDPNHENTKFWQASPSGSLQLGCINLEAAEKFALGKEYYLDFTPAD